MTENKLNGLIDSNILVYSFELAEKEKREKAKIFLEQRLKSKDSFVSIQNLAEFHYNITERMEKPVDIETAKNATNKFSLGFNVISYGILTILNASNYQKIHKLHFWDALLAATMEENSIDTIFTENEKDFKKIPWMKVINPLK